MTVTYDEKDTRAINFAKWLSSKKNFQKYDNSHSFVLWVQETPMHPTVEELYRMYLKQL